MTSGDWETLASLLVGSLILFGGIFCIILLVTVVP